MEADINCDYFTILPIFTFCLIALFFYLFFDRDGETFPFSCFSAKHA